MIKRVKREVHKHFKRLLTDRVSINPSLGFFTKRSNHDNRLIYGVYVKKKYSNTFEDTVISTVEVDINYTHSTGDTEIVVHIESLHDNRKTLWRRSYELEELYLKRTFLGIDYYVFNHRLLKDIINNKGSQLGAYINHTLYYVHQQMGIYPTQIGVHRSKDNVY